MAIRPEAAGAATWLDALHSDGRTWDRAFSTLNTDDLLADRASIPITTRPQRTTDPAVTVDQATIVAVAAIERWRRTVRVLPLLVGSDELRLALRGLSAWFERVCVDADYVTEAPADGIEALHRITRLNTGTPAPEVLVAWWVVRVAHEVVKCRRRLRSMGDRNTMDLPVALSQLELSLYGGYECVIQGSRVHVQEAGPARNALSSVRPPHTAA